MYTLVIANRNYSSWSLRAWLYLTESGISFDVVRIPLFTGNWKEQILRYSPAGRAPVLLDDDITVWDSAAIIEYLREQNADAVGWPTRRAMRAHARSICAEMHSGFLALRDELPQNLRARRKISTNELSESCRAQARRIDEIWSDCRTRYGDSGAWLFGNFSIADVMFAPVALRFVTYSIPVCDRAQEYIAAVRGLDSVQEWIDAAREEPEALTFIDDLIPAAASPLTPG